MRFDCKRYSMDEFLTDPSKFFAKPLNVVACDSMAREKKHRILGQWRVDAEALSTAKAENLGDGEASRLREVLEALRCLEQDGDGARAQSMRGASVGTTVLGAKRA